MDKVVYSLAALNVFGFTYLTYIKRPGGAALNGVALVGWTFAIIEPKINARVHKKRFDNSN